jgi:dihydroxyacetone kinase-like protein
MTNGWTTANLREGIRRVSEKIAECADELNKLDGMLGDGDLGVTVSRGFRNLVDELPDLPDDIGMALLKCAQAFTRVSGSTYGTLLATGMMSAAKITRGKTVISWREISPLLAEAINAMARRGKSQLSDKTLLDAIEGARKATEGLDNPDEIAKAANNGVAMALEQFRLQPSRQGRARIFGEKSIGLDDPGMVAFKRIVEGLL